MTNVPEDVAYRSEVFCAVAQNTSPLIVSSAAIATHLVVLS